MGQCLIPQIVELPRIPQPRGDGLYALPQQVALRVQPAAYQLDLDQVERIDIRVSNTDRTLQPVDAGEQVLALGGFEHKRAGPVEFGADCFEEACALAITHKLRVVSGDLHITLGQRQLGVMDHAAEHRPARIHRAAGLEVDAAQARA